jgi:PAS domain S-box-containing protein
MTLRRKTILIIGATLAGLLLILFAVSQGILLKDVAHQGQTTLLYFLCLLLGTGLVFIGVIYVLLDRLVLSPLSRLSATVSSIGRTGVLSARVSATGKDELSNLAGEINRMLGAIEGSHKALQESEEKFKRLVEDMGDGYFVAQGYRLVYANSRSAEMFGYSVPEVINKPVAELLAPDLVEELSELHYKRLRGEIVRHQYEVTLVRNDGKVVDVEFSARRMYYESRPAVSVVMRDITERKKAEEALRQSEEHYSTLVRSLTEAVFKFKGKVITWCNDRVEEIYGYKKDELIGKNADSLFPEGVSHSQFIQEVSTAINQQGYFRGSGMVKRKDESLVHVEYTISQIPGTEPRELVAVARDITERKRIEDEVATSEAKYRSLVETASAGVATIDLKGEFVLVNKALCGMVGYSQKELIGSNFADFLYPDDGAQLLNLFAEGLASQNEHPTFEFRTIHRDGHIVWLCFSPVALVHENDTIGFSAIIHDITKRVQIEEALRQSEEKLKRYLESSPDLICVIDLKGTILFINKAAERVTGYSAEELLGKRFLELPIFTPEYLSKPPQLLEHDQAGRPTEPSELELIRKDGSRVDVEISYLFTGSIIKGGKTEIIGIARDITERKLMEKALRQSEERFRNVLDNSLDMIYSLNLQTGKYEYVSPSSKRMLGYSPEEFRALDSGDLVSLVHPDDAEELEQNIVNLLTHGENRTLSTEYRIKHKELDYRWASDNRSVVYDDGNMPVAIVGSLRDVTDHKQAEEKLKQTMAKLARSNTELERFAYVASHDLQEPLRMVASYTQLLARRYKGKLDSDADEFIGYAVDGATRMQQLINALLDYSRVSTRGKSFEPTDCEDVLNRAVTNLQAAIEENGAVVTHDQLPTVMADSSQMVQLFQNLIGNAIKFHSEKKPKVHVGAERNGTECIFSVRDNGIGIDPQYFDRIFVIFQRLHGRGEYPGTGIGLAICKKIIERHKGRIWVESQPGKGATFYFTIPIRREEKP